MWNLSKVHSSAKNSTEIKSLYKYIPKCAWKTHIKIIYII